MEYIVDYNFYKNTYGGPNDIDTDLFIKIRNTAEVVILTIVNPSFIETNQEDIAHAICLEIDYLFENNYESIIKGADSINFQSESYPGYSYSRKTGTSAITNVGGITLVPTANLYLMRRGLLYRGTPYVV